jgi:hypothetical protein
MADRSTRTDGFPTRGSQWTPHDERLRPEPYLLSAQSQVPVGGDGTGAASESVIQEQRSIRLR